LPSKIQQDDEFRNGFPFFGGRLWIDLLNTTPSDGVSRQDLIETPDSFAKWLDGAGIVAPHSQRLREAKEDASKLREKLRSTFQTLKADAVDLTRVLQWTNARLRDVSVRFVLERDEKGVRLVELLDPGAASPSDHVVKDFARFVCEYEPARLKHCANPACTMVFYDIGKNNTRRWCTMSICGNRDKVARYRSRKSDAARTKR
jgi:predicted RNA-binding Zn ribbon-like protein